LAEALDDEVDRDRTIATLRFAQHRTRESVDEVRVTVRDLALGRVHQLLDLRRARLDPAEKMPEYRCTGTGIGRTNAR